MKNNIDLPIKDIIVILILLFILYNTWFLVVGIFTFIGAIWVYERYKDRFKNKDD